VQRFVRTSPRINGIFLPRRGWAKTYFRPYSGALAAAAAVPSGKEVFIIYGSCPSGNEFRHVPLSRATG